MNIGVIGFGNLGKAFVKGLLGPGKISSSSIHVTARSRETMTEARERYHLSVCQSAAQVAQRCDCVFLAVKPDTMDGILGDIGGCSGRGKTLVSLAAGVSLAHIRQRLPEAFGVARAMPSLAVMTGRGIIGLSMEDGLDEDRRRVLRELLASMGEVMETDDEGIDRITALSACGLAFAAYAVEAFAGAGRELGLPGDGARRMALQVFGSALETLEREDLPPCRLMDRVATPGGATEEGLRQLERREVMGAFAAAVEAAYRKVSPSER